MSGEQTKTKVEAVAPAEFKELQVKVNGMSERIDKAVETAVAAKNMCRDMDSRVIEIEQFRNHAAVEGKMRALTSELENITTSIGQLKGNLKKEIERIDNVIAALKSPVSTGKGQ